jgi:hypothetical protein
VMSDKNMSTWYRCCNITTHCCCLLHALNYHTIFEEPDMLEIIKLSEVHTDDEITTWIPLTENTDCRLLVVSTALYLGGPA